jgi:hypothetical protein
VSFIAAGACTIDANQAGNAEFGAAPQTQQSFAVGTTPTLTPVLELVSHKEVLTPPAPTPNSTFALLGAPAVNAKTGAVTFRLSVSDPGTLSWVLTFANGKFGVFSAKNAHCKSGQIKLGGRCRPASIVFAKGSKAVAAPGTVTFTVTPSASAVEALKSALHKKKRLPVIAAVTFQSSHGGSPVTHKQSLSVSPKK